MAPPRFKVLNDETNLVGVSMSMYQSKTASVPIQGFNLGYKKPQFKTSIDKRPLLYPLLISFVHALRGYSAFNGFIVNFICGIFALFVLYLFVYEHFPRIYALLSILILASLPNFVMWVTSSGFETLNLFFIIFTIFLFNRVIVTRNIQQAELLFLTLVLVSQCRYESVVYTIAIIFLLPMLLRKEAISQWSPISFISPALFIPIIWLYRLYAEVPVVNKMAANVAPVPNLFEAFKFSNLISNTPPNLLVFLGLDPHLGFSWFISAMSIAGIYLITKRLIVDYRSEGVHLRTMWLFGVATFILLYVVQVSFYLGNMTIYTQNRFAMVYLPYMVLPAIYFAYVVFKKTKNTVKVFVVIFFVLHLIYFWPYGSQQLLVNSGALQYEYKKTLTYIKDHFKNSSDILVISERPYLFTVHYSGAVDFNYANQNTEIILDLGRKDFDHILVIQKCLYKTRAPLSSSRLSSTYHLVQLGKLNLTRFEYLRISEISKW
ncbi:MAG: glycosyltransferase family 39 protein [Desulfobacterales bacterium]